MKWLLLIVLFFCAVSITSAFATSVQVTKTTYQSDSGLLYYIYYETSSGPGSSTPSTNTAQTPSSSTGSYSVSKGSSAYLWSKQFSSSATISAGNWVLDLWALGSSSGTMQVSIYVTNSAGTAQSTISSDVVTSTIGTSKTAIVVESSGSQVSVPSSGYIEAVLDAPSSGPSSFTIYWGKAQLTDFQVPYHILST